MSETVAIHLRRPSGTVFMSVRTRSTNLGDGLILHALIMSVLDNNHDVVLQAGGVPDYFVDFVLTGLDSTRITLVAGGYWRLAFRTGLRHRLRYSVRKPGAEGVGPTLFLTPGHQVLNVSTRSAFRKALFACLLLILRKSGLRLGRVGISLAPPMTDRSRILERLVGRNCSLYAVRDTFSLDIAHSIGLSAAELAPDMSVLLRTFSAEKNQRGDSIGVSMRKLGSEDDLQSNALSLICQTLGASSNSIVAISQTGADLPSTRNFIERAGLFVPEEVELHGSIRTVDELLEHYRRYRLVVSNRLHVVLAALIAGTPSVAVVDETINVKVSSALEALGVGGIAYKSNRDSHDSISEEVVQSLLQEATNAVHAIEIHAEKLGDRIAIFLAGQ